VVLGRKIGEKMGVPNWGKGDVWVRGEVVTVVCGGL